MFTNDNIQKLKTILKDFYTITKIRIAIFDENFNSAAKYPAESPLFCRIVQEKTDNAACTNCDRNAIMHAAKSNAPYIYRCHAGLTECVMPITANTGSPIGYIMLGHMYTANEQDDEQNNIFSQCEKYGIERKEVENALSMLNVWDNEYIISASHIIQYLASYILTENMYTLNPDDVPLKVASYIEAHYAEKISINGILQNFGIGKTTLYKLFTQKYDMGIATYLRKTRLSHARELLVNTAGISIPAVCEKCGFENFNYFSVCFKNEYGLSPKAYAEKHR